ncbi:peroxidasin homolog isoform X2 [Babylonia areolata]|uniref:peroxidasin homolog isoform X2 n=1 Tax=Babylonia areolata TaxID=304850 RepID=UPI003FD37754
MTEPQGHKETQAPEIPQEILLLTSLVDRKEKLGRRQREGRRESSEPVGGCGPSGPEGEAGVPVPPCCAKLAAPDNAPSVITLVAETGSDVFLPCNVTGYPPPKVTWSPPFPVSARHVLADGGVLIRDVQMTDQNRYTCEVRNVFGASVTVVSLVVREPITVQLETPSSRVNQHDNLTLTCTYSGFPVPSIAWTHTRTDGHNETLTSEAVTNHEPGGPGTSVLTLRDVDARDGGKYECQATNQYERKGGVVNVAVNSVPIIVQRPQSQSVLSGQSVRLYCGVLGDPVPTVTWSYPQGGQPFNVHVMPDGSLLLVEADSYNSGPYTCTASNSNGQLVLTATLTVTTPVTAKVTPVLTSLHGTSYVALTCVGAGQPAPTLSWTKLETSLPEDSARYIILPETGDLVISGVSPGTEERDSGVYVCTAVSGHSSATGHAIVYKDVQTLSCTTTFGLCSHVGAVCGGSCPSNCTNSETLKGYLHYTLDSAVCVAAVQAGVIAPRGQGGPVVWQVQDGARHNITAAEANGVTSQRGDKQSTVAGILDPSAPDPVL